MPHATPSDPDSSISRTVDAVVRYLRQVVTVQIVAAIEHGIVVTPIPLAGAADHEMGKDWNSEGF